jgi:hypothetical protein
MGGQASVATIYPAFDQQVVYAGQNATGKVYVSVIQEEVSCVSVGCRIIGQELTAVTYTTSDSKGNQSSHTAIEKRRFMDMKICLHSRPEGVIRGGHYEFPFSFTMPASAPATTYSGDSVHCGYINYTMKVWLDRPGSLRWDIRNKSTVIVAPTLAVQARTPMYMPPQRLDLRSLLFLDRGNVFLGWKMETDVIYAGEMLTFKFAVANFTEVRIMGVCVKLTQYSKFNAHGHCGATKKRLCWTHFTPEQVGLSDAVPLVQSDQEAALERLREALRSANPTAHIPSCTVRIPVPLDAASSYQNGEHFEIRHELKVKLWTTFGTNNVRVTQQVFVLNPDPVHVPEKRLRSDKCGPALQLPTNWAPHIEPVAVLPEIPVDMGALSRPGAKITDRGPLQYAANAHVTPMGYPVIEVENYTVPNHSVASAPPAAECSNYVQAEIAPYVD